MAIDLEPNYYFHLLKPNEPNKHKGQLLEKLDRASGEASNYCPLIALVTFYWDIMRQWAKLADECVGGAEGKDLQNVKHFYCIRIHADGF